MRILVVFALLATASTAHAQTSSPSPAESLFEQGRAQMAGGDYIGACPKFEESYNLEPANGTLLALALCHEAQGRWASALSEFVAVAAASARDGRTDRADVAREHIASLEPKVAPAVPPPPLIVPAEPLASPLPPARPSSPSSVQRVLGIVVAGIGAAAIGVGAWEGLRAIAENNDARARCAASPCANVTGLSLSQSAFQAATASDVLFGAGALTLVVGGYLWFSAPRAALSVSLGPRSALLRLQW
jgi:hypothetical protein